jgi:dihydrodipicolinate synthase/N-acetylneuraminate lyase
MKKAAIKQELEGVIPILPVPFVSSGAVDEASFRRVVEAAIGDGVHGVALFGLASEYAKLADSERVQLTRALVDQAAGRVPAIISITHHSLEVAKREAVTAAEIGADALMVLPPFFLSPGAEAVEAHIGAIAAEVDLPVIVQYAPIETGSSLSAEGLAALHNRHGNFEYIKVDVVPSGPMVTRVKSVGLKAMVGYMGLSLPQDVERGAVAVLPTASVSKAFVHLWKLLDEAPEEGRKFHQQLLPLLTLMMQSVEMLVAVEKVFLHRRGLLAFDYCRAPRWNLDAGHRREIDRLCVEYEAWLFPTGNPRGNPYDFEH